MITFLYELINFLVVLTILFVVLIYLKLDILKSSLLILHLVAIFLLNDVLFPASYMSDQFGYVDVTQVIRKDGFPTLSISMEGIKSGYSPTQPLLSSSGFSGSLFALAPIPFINSVRSIAMINFLIILFLFVFLKNKRMSNNAVDFFLLVYPSLLLYSSVALRDTLIFLFMFLGIYFFLIKRNYLFSLIFSAPLIILKFQNFLIICLSIVLYHIVKGGVRLYKIFFLATSLFLFSLLRNVQIDRWTLVEMFSINTLEGMRYALFAENYGYDMSLVAELGYNPVNSIPEFILITIKGFFRFVLGPFIWSFENLFQLIQSIENIVIIMLMTGILFTRKYFKETREKILYLNVLLITGFSIYGFVVFNLGSAARYKFVFIGVYMILSYYLIKRDHLLARKMYINRHNPINNSVA